MVVTPGAGPAVINVRVNSNNSKKGVRPIFLFYGNDVGKIGLTPFFPLERAGFTLTELIIALVIVGILAGIALPKFGRIMERSRQAEAITILGAMRGAQIRYYTDNNNSYTSNTANLDIELPDNNGDNAQGDGEFFDYTIPSPQNDSQVARAARNGISQTGGSAGYRLRINRNGVISCDFGTCVDIQ